ncbi:MAG TPA: sensor domain-containing protein [Dokdonella sp.]|uniref:sensor domain-containing protein n=1 Tax=Dokdonella sp. TaxID=2291710 RepID=UPI002CC7211C|nr:sensor domain-containing protein [Dokdonella sp.]HOX70222.1 sensor domain-containing protein [Dokdonella sp.]HPG94419.1 sensor domain-containing protein [Dokdonella sp.]
MNHPIAKTIREYLDQLRSELHGADPAMIQDALYDAEEHLRAELAEHPQLDEAAVLAKVATSYGAPDEVAEIYRVKEGEVEQALRPRRVRPVAEKSFIAKFFGVAVDPRAYAAMFYMVLAMATGIFYFTWVVTGLSLSAGFAILIIGIPFIVLFFATVRALSFVEGKIVEAMLGVRMPRRPLYVDREKSIWQRIGAMFTDPRSWSTLFYMVLMLPLGILYFCIVTVGMALALGFIVAPFLHVFGYGDGIVMRDGSEVLWSAPVWAMPLVFVGGVLLLFAMLHIARGIGHLHGQLAKHLLVKAA